MIKEIEYSPEALEDLQGIVGYISVNLYNEQAAKRIVKEIVDMIDTLIDMPEIGAPLSSRIDTEKDYRYLVCGNYNIFYRAEEQSIKIIRVLNARRDFKKLLF